MRPFLLLVILFLLRFYAGFPQEIEWACRVIESNDGSKEDSGPKGILGVPNVYPLKKVSTSWNMGYPGQEDKQTSFFVKLHFCKPIFAKQVIVVENLNPGSIKEIFVYDTKMNEKQIYKAEVKSDTVSHRILSIKIDTLLAPVNYIKIVTYPSLVEGPNCIDAVGITASDKPVKLNINLDQAGNFVPTFQYLNGNINTIYDEYSPVISPDGKTLYFARMGDHQNKGGKNGDLDIWYSEQDSLGQWAPAKNIGSPLNTIDLNFVASVVANGGGLLLGTTYGPNGKSLGEGCALSHKVKNKWTSPQNLNLKEFYNQDAHVSFFLGNNEKVLLMSIADNDHSFGDQDIYVSFLKEDNSWSPPLNIGPTINTVNSEKNIFLSPDMHTMYFSSNGFLGYGGHDIYKSKRLDSTWQKWSKPINLGPVINSEEDEYCFVTTADGKFGYGYKYSNEQQKNEIFSVGLFAKPKIVRSDSVVSISGKIIEFETGSRISAKITFHNLHTGKEKGMLVSEQGTGKYESLLPKDTAYSISVNAPGYMPVTENIPIPLKGGFQQVKKDITLVPIEIGHMVKLTNVFFHKGTSALIENSFLELNQIFQFLKDNPTVSIRLEGHTDNQGDALENFKLSEERVKTVREYLVKYGINSKRIDFKAFGGTSPVASNTEEETRKLNRRVDFVIIKNNYFYCLLNQKLS